MRCVSTLAFLLLFALAAFGQSDLGSITGTITDPQGAVTPNASIDIKNVDNGTVFHSGTSGSGNYVVPVPAGKYELTVTAAGFKKYVRENLQVTTATATRQDIKLDLGALTDTITITDEAPLLKTETGEISHEIATDDVNQLPLLTTTGGGFTGVGAYGNIRNPLQEISILPGTSFSNDNVLVVNGIPANSESIRIEGQDSTSTIWKIAQQNSQGGVDAIQEVAVQTSNFAPEFGQAAGGYFNYTMKSGTNAFHGSAYDYLANEALNAGMPFTDAGLKIPSKRASMSATRRAATITALRLAARYGFPNCTTAETRLSSSSTSNNSARTTPPRLRPPRSRRTRFAEVRRLVARTSVWRSAAAIPTASAPRTSRC